MRRVPAGLAKPFLVRGMFEAEMRELMRHAKARHVTRNKFVAVVLRRELARLRGDAVPESGDPQDQGEAFPVLVQKHGYARAKAIEAARAARVAEERQAARGIGTESETLNDGGTS